MDKFHWLVLRALLWLVRHAAHRPLGGEDTLIKDLEAEIKTAEKAGFEYYREKR